MIFHSDYLFRQRYIKSSSVPLCTIFLIALFISRSCREFCRRFTFSRRLNYLVSFSIFNEDDNWTDDKNFERKRGQLYVIDRLLIFDNSSSNWNKFVRSFSVSSSIKKNLDFRMGLWEDGFFERGRGSENHEAERRRSGGSPRLRTGGFKFKPFVSGRTTFESLGSP